MSGVGQLAASGPLVIAVPLAVAAGVVSFASPCSLPLVPGYLSYVSGMAGADAAGGGVLAAGRGRTVAGTLLFTAGFAALFVAYGALFGGLGAALLSHQQVFTRVLGVFTIGFGLLFMGLLDRLPLAGAMIRPAWRPHAGLGGAPVLGFMFGLGWTPCIGPTLAAVLALSATAGGAGRGAFLAFAYSVGLGLPFVALAAGFAKALRAASFARRHARSVMRAGGGLLIAIGVLEVSGAWIALLNYLRPWLIAYRLPL